MRPSSSRPASSARSPSADERGGGAAGAGWKLRVGWGLPAPGTALPPDEVHVAFTLIERPEESLAELDELLSEDERGQMKRFRFAADQRRFTVCRGMLRLWLAHYIGTAPERIRFVYGPNGKPAVEGEGSDFHFNLSHSGGLAAFAITRAGEVGIDLEQVHELPGWEQISVLCFAPEERSLLNAHSAVERQRQFFRLWTRHEAWLKAWGVGLGGAQPRPEADEAWARPGAAGWMQTFEPAPGYLATVAVLDPAATG
jgi:4'-phosphopantetheinyl transferase